MWGEVGLKGVYSHDLTAVFAAIQIVESRKYPLRKMVSHKLSLVDAEKAVRIAGGEIPGEDPIKVVIVP